MGYCLLTAITFLPVIARGDSISTEVVCDAGPMAMTSATSCSESYTENGITATAQEEINLSVTSPTNSSDYFVLQLSNSGDARDGYYEPPDAGASASANVDFTLTTAGPERSGYIQVVQPGFFFAEYSITGLSLSIGTLPGDACTGEFDCSIAEAPAIYPDTYNFTLGNSFSFDFAYSSLLDATFEDGQADTTGDYTLEFRFLESDGVTPVAILPEPSTWIPVCTALLCLAAFSLRKRYGYSLPTRPLKQTGQTSRRISR